MAAVVRGAQLIAAAVAQGGLAARLVAIDPGRDVCLQGGDAGRPVLGLEPAVLDRGVDPGDYLIDEQVHDRTSLDAGGLGQLGEGLTGP
ncbi:MAG: hypothetical protein OXH28_09235 [bacterium]|nr:hypothetical protein [bacterium]